MLSRTHRSARTSCLRMLLEAEQLVLLHRGDNHKRHYKGDQPHERPQEGEEEAQGLLADALSSPLQPNK
jgi:hypothetical protein